MKAIVCEMCSSHDVVKQDGYYVCQSCGTKYSTEDAKKLMVEIAGKVDVSGSTVSVDTTDATKRSLENARRAMQKEDWDEAEKYYNLVEQNDPSNIEAIFYSAYAKAKTTLVVEDIYRREAVFKSFGKSISIIDDNFDVANEEGLRPMVDKMTADIVALCNSQFVYTVKKDGYGNVKESNAGQTRQMFLGIKREMYESLNNIGSKLKKTENSASAHYYLLAKLIVDSVNDKEIFDSHTRSSFKRDRLVVIAEGLMGTDDKTALAIFKDAVTDYEKEVKSGITKEEAEEYYKFCDRVFPLIQTVDPSFNAKEELRKATETAATGKKKLTRKANITCVIILLILAGICYGMLTCAMEC